MKVTNIEYLFVNCHYIVLYNFKGIILTSYKPIPRDDLGKPSRSNRVTMYTKICEPVEEMSYRALEEVDGGHVDPPSPKDTVEPSTKVTITSCV